MHYSKPHFCTALSIFIYAIIFRFFKDYTVFIFPDPTAFSHPISPLVIDSVVNPFKNH
ncbi:hypothetical protein HMP0721_0887 [Pseudoramibacter alactolyticus ATCC 23263]|uniref:Uncharacterized protein n=1 Tax=Pseudoramibacter alactolyticus ATCC 23263 TaxID=887929 RepID=E6MFK4_9FIRM|nr:hypothetical protein HMP0721_0887 [Pseudoramibacter alactolyticus ATCC 23263]